MIVTRSLFLQGALRLNLGSHGSIDGDPRSSQSVIRLVVVIQLLCLHFPRIAIVLGLLSERLHFLRVIFYHVHARLRLLVGDQPLLDEGHFVVFGLHLLLLVHLVSLLEVVERKLGLLLARVIFE